MSNVEIKSTGPGTYSIKVDGQEVSSSLRGLTIQAGYDVPIVTLEVIADELDINLDEAEVKVTSDEPRDFGFYKLRED